MEGFFGIGIQELILIAIVALIVLGPERLPAALREVAKFIRQVRNLTNEFTSQFGDDFKALEDLDPRRILQREIESIDEEENKSKPATAAKSTSTKPTTTATKPATATTAKTTTNTPKPATTNTAKSAASPPPAKSVSAPSSSSSTATTAATTAASNHEATATTASTASVNGGEGENRIAPPAIVTAATDESAVVTTTVAHSGSVNGSAPKENETSVATSGVADTPITTNGAQEHSTVPSE